MQEKVEIITNHFEHYWTKIPKNGYCGGGEILYNQISIDEIAREEIVDFTNIFQEWGPDI